MGDFNCPLCHQSFSSLKEVSMHCANCDPPQLGGRRQGRGGEQKGKKQGKVVRKEVNIKNTVSDKVTKKE